MSNVAKILKAEISRISRKEIKAVMGEIGKSHVTLKKVVADLKRRLASLEKDNKRLVAEARKQKAESAEKSPEKTEKARFTAKGIRSLRGRLGVTQAGFAKLLGTSTHSVYLWEKKDGPLKLRDKTKEALLSLRGVKAREARTKLDEKEGTRKKGRSVARKRK